MNSTSLNFWKVLNIEQFCKRTFNKIKVEYFRKIRASSWYYWKTLMIGISWRWFQTTLVSIVIRRRMVWVGRVCTMEWAHLTQEHIKGSRSRPHSIKCLMVSIWPRLFQSVTGVPKQQFTPGDWPSCCSMRWEWLLSRPVLECNWCSPPMMYTSGTGRTKSGTNRWQPILHNEKTF